MTAIELDQKFREVLQRVTPETVLTETAALVELGFSASVAFVVLSKALSSGGTPKGESK